MKAESTIKKHLRGLRCLINGSEDVIEKRIAYAMECAVLWVISDARGMDGLVQEAAEEAQILRQELNDD